MTHVGVIRVPHYSTTAKQFHPMPLPSFFIVPLCDTLLTANGTVEKLLRMHNWKWMAPASCWYGPGVLMSWAEQQKCEQQQ